MEAFLVAHYVPAVFFGAFFFGESVIVTSAYLTAELNWPIAYVLLAALCGTIVSDTLWFLFGGVLRERFAQSKLFLKQRTQAADMVLRLTGNRPFLALLFIKFLYGSRIAMIMYIAAQKVSLATFMLYNSIGAIIWLLVFGSLGYFVGRSIVQTLPLINALTSGVIILIVSAVLLKLFAIWLTKKLIK